MKTFPSRLLIAAFGLSSAASPFFFYYIHIYRLYARSLIVGGGDGAGGISNLILATTFAAGSGVFGFLLASLAISATWHGTHSLREVLLTQGLGATLTVFVFLFNRQMYDVDQGTVAILQLAILAPSTTLLVLVLLNRRFHLIRRPRKDSGNTPVFLEKTTPAHLRVRWAWAALGCAFLAVTIFLLLEYAVPGYNSNRGFVTGDGIAAGTAATVFGAGGISWLIQALPMRKITHLSLLISQVPLALPLLAAYQYAGDVVAVIISLVLAAWLVASLYLLAPLASIAIRFLPGQTRLVQTSDAMRPGIVMVRPRHRR